MAIKNSILNFIRSLFKFYLLEQLLILFTQRQKYGGWMRILVPNHTQYTSNTIRRGRRFGVYYELDISDLMDWYVYFGFRELEKEHFFMSLKKDDIIFDVGANLGQFSITSAHIAKKGMVYSFEPDQNNFNKLQKNISLNQINNLKISQIALGNEVGMGNIKVVDSMNKGMNKIELNIDGGVKITTLDSFVEQNQISKVDKIKIDTEGFEYKILQGGRETLEKFHPFLFLEIDDKNLKEQGVDPQTVIHFLISLGYQIYYPGNLKKVDLTENYNNCHFDIIAF